MKSSSRSHTAAPQEGRLILMGTVPDQVQSHAEPIRPLEATPAWRIPQLVFFQAEDGIRDATVTGDQTCALPISSRRRHTIGRPDGRKTGKVAALTQACA